MKLLLPFIALLLSFAPPKATRPTTWTDKYVSGDFYYSVALPPKVVAINRSDANSNRGFCIRLSAAKAQACDERRMISAVAFYDYTESHLLSEIAEHELYDAKKLSLNSAKVAFQRNEKLSGHDARRYRVVPTATDGPQVESVVCLRHRPGQEGIIYVVSLYSSPATFDEDYKLYEKILAGFHLEPWALGELDPFKTDIK